MKNIIGKVVSGVKSVVKTVVKTVKNCYNRFIKPWAQHIVNFAKNYIPVCRWVYRGYKIIKIGWNKIVLKKNLFFFKLMELNLKKIFIFNCKKIYFK